jgi:hypothetical protein
MIVDQSGTLASVKRHDYLPFGEEIGGPQVPLLGGRTPTQGYAGDSTRQHFTGYEADGETGLNFAEARGNLSLKRTILQSSRRVIEAPGGRLSDGP